MCAKDSITTQTCELLQEEFNDFLTLYPVPSEYHVILPKSNQIIFDVPPGYVGFVRVFPDPILFLAGLKPSWEHGQQRPTIMAGGKEIAFRNFIYTKDNEDLAFLPKEPSQGFGTGSPSVSFIWEYSGSNRDRKCKTKGGSSRPPIKRKLASGSSTSLATRAKTSSSKDDAPFLTVSDDDKDRCDARHKNRERAREEECEGLRVKCEATMTKFEKNPAVVALQEKIFVLFAESKVTSLEAEKARLEAVEVSLRKEVEELKQDRKEVVSMVVPYVTMKLVHSDDMGSLVGKLVSSAIVFGRRRAFEQVADMKEPFYLSKERLFVLLTRGSILRSSIVLATTSFPWLNELWLDQPQLLLNPYCQRKPHSAKTSSFKDSSPLTFFSKGYPVLGSSLQSNVSSCRCLRCEASIFSTSLKVTMFVLIQS
ncbi:hypothetical protein Tco_0751795 [Tanacetum coccineum]|uniref:Uncharacterized protein n=1 Tax=Tanacetum coccineum TaxID=301880 RepID=A0ABQ4Z519_9ASTR